MGMIRSSGVYNSPVEIGLRALMLLAAAHPVTLDLQRLVILDYLLVHSGDLENGPESLHPASPLRAGEVSVRRELIEHGLHLLALKGLVARSVDDSGISYLAEEAAAAFLDALTSHYSSVLRSRAMWAIEIAGAISHTDATALLEKTIGKWKMEFLVENVEDVL